AESLRTRAAESALPDPEAVKAVLALEQDVRLAEAALGGGLSVTVTPRKPLAVQVRADGGEVRRAKGETPVTVEAGRAVELSLGDLADVSILAGDAEKRKRAEAL